MSIDPYQFEDISLDRPFAWMCDLHTRVNLELGNGGPTTLRAFTIERWHDPEGIVLWNGGVYRKVVAYVTPHPNGKYLLLILSDVDFLSLRSIDFKAASKREVELLERVYALEDALTKAKLDE